MEEKPVAQVRHDCATTTHAVRAAIERSKASVAAIAEVRTEEGKLHMYVAIDRTSKFAFVELHERAARSVACKFLRHLIEAVPYQIHTVLTENGVQFCRPPHYRDAPTAC